jgi:hypothetical protein
MKQKDLTAISTIKTDGLKAESPRSIQDLLRGNSAGLSIGLLIRRKEMPACKYEQKYAQGRFIAAHCIGWVIYEGSLSDINPMDVQSIDV